MLSRGNRGEDIFKDNHDKEYFLQTMRNGTSRYGIEIHAYCIMNNHYHLLLSTPRGDLTRFMHFTGSSYGSYQCRERGWVGHVFAGRYKSLCIEKGSYLLELSRYIHLNPVRARIVAFPEEYRWSSYRHYIGWENCPGWVDTKWFIAEYGRDCISSRKRYREFVEAGIENPSDFPKEKIFGQSLLGNKGFIEKTIRKIRRKTKSDCISSRRLFKNCIDLYELYQHICDYYYVRHLGRSQKGFTALKRARAMYIYLARENTMALNREISSRLGDLSPSGVSHQYWHIVRRIAGNDDFSGEWRRQAAEIYSRFKA